MKELSKRYAIVLRKCAILNMLVLAGSLCATPATADVTSLDGLYPDGVVSGNLKYEAGEQVSLNTDSVKVESGSVYADYGSSIQIGNEGHTENVSIISDKRGISVYDENSRQYDKNITNFKNSVATNGGYYIGRYEART